MKRYEITLAVQEKIADVNNYDEYLNATKSCGSRTVEATNLYRAVVAARKRETQEYDEAIEVGDSYYYPDWLEVWEIGDDGLYSRVRRYVLPMRDM